MKKKIDLTTGNIMRKLLIVAIPTLLSSVIQMAYSLTDMFWVTKVDSMGLDPAEAIAGIGTAGFYPWFGFGVIMLAKIGTSVKVSHAAGENDMEKVTKYGNNGLILMFVLGILYTLIGFFGKDIYISLFNSSNPNVVLYATQYLGIVSLFGTSYFLVNLFNGIYDGLGKTINTLFITASGLVLNMILDPIFILESISLFGVTITGLGLGVRGAAIATGISQTFILLTYVGVYISKYRPIKIDIRNYFDFKAIKDIIKIGMWVSMQSIIFTSISMYIARMITSYGTKPMAVQRIGSQIEAVAWMVASGFQVAMASFVGQNFGAKNLQRIKEGYVSALKLLVPYGLIVNVGMFIFAKQLMGIFFVDEETLLIGKRYLEILSFSQLFMIVELSTAGAFNGLGKTMFPSAVGVVGNSLRIPIGFLLSVSLGYAGIWYAVSLSSIIKGILLVLLFIIYFKRIRKDKFLFVENEATL